MLYLTKTRPLILELTSNNHFEFGFNGVPFSRRQSVEDQWFARYGRAKRMPGTFKEECLTTARLIRASTSQDLWVLFSGGIDSEVTLRAFVDAGIKVKVAINRFAKDLNIHDLAYAVATCEALEVEYQFFNLDIEDFWRTKLLSYLQMTDCCWPRLTPTMWLMEQVPGYPILGSGECYLEKILPAGYIPGSSPYVTTEWVLFEREKIASWYRFLLAINKPGCAGFFQYTPEIILSYLEDPEVEALCRSEVFGKLSTRTSKHQIYTRHFALTERPKYTGFEKIADLDRYYQTVGKHHFPHHDGIFKTPYRELLGQLRPVAKTSNC